MAVANTGLSAVTGDVGVGPTYAVTGFPPGLVTDGAIHVGDPLAVNAHADAQAAYTRALNQPCLFDMTGLDLGGRTVSAGVACYPAAAALTGTQPLVLDGQGDPNAIFLFKIGSTLDTAAGSSVALSNGAQACNVFWQVTGAAGLGANTHFAGNILAATSITSGAGVTNHGGLYALNGAVTLDSNQITACAIGPATATPTATRTSTPTLIPSPTSTSTITPTATLVPTHTVTATPVAVPTAANPNLAAAASFGVLGAMAVANTGLSAVTGDVGVGPTYAVTGFPPGLVTDGAIHVGDPLAVNAHADVQAAYTRALNQPCLFDMTGLDLGGRTVSAGVACYPAAAALTGTQPLVLDGQGDPNAIFLFKIGSTLDTAAGSSVALSNGAQACNVFWQVTGAAGLGANTHFAGNILAATSITSGAGVTNHGGLYALTGAVTLDSNQITACAIGPAGARAANLANLVLPPMVHSNSADQASGTLALTVSDATDSGSGWHVSIQSLPFVYVGDNAGTDIPADQFSITLASPPIATAGQAIDAEGGPKIPAAGVNVSLDQPRMVLQASPGYGAGTYTQDLAVSLNIPAQSRVGTYLGTLITSIGTDP